jgi:membrane dipeptidase
MKPIIVDAHEDLAWNILTFDRDYRRSARETRKREAGTEIPARNGDCLLGFPEYQQGRVSIVFSTLFVSPKRRILGGWDAVSYADFEQAHRQYRTQVDVYHRLAEENPDYFRLITDKKSLHAHLNEWKETGVEHPVGLVLLMEGAEGVRHPGELEEWWGLGVHVIGPAWAGTRYCGGTREPGPLTKEGYALLDGMADLGFVLDLSHMDAEAAMQALSHYPRQIIASHANALRPIKSTETNRHLPDEVIHGLIERDGVIGIVPLNSFLRSNWRRFPLNMPQPVDVIDDRRLISLDAVVEQIDYICQLAGSARHVGLGTDFDGGFGLQSVPDGIDTIADLPALIPYLEKKGYSPEDIAAIMGGNWLRVLHDTLPEAR